MGRSELVHRIRSSVDAALVSGIIYMSTYVPKVLVAAILFCAVLSAEWQTESIILMCCLLQLHLD